MAWGLALVLAAQHWGHALATRYTTGRISTGGVAIRPALSVDQLTASMLVLATTVALLVQIYSIAFMNKDPRYPSYTALVLLFTSAMALVVAADELFVLLVGWEVMGACSYFLIAHYWERKAARDGRREGLPDHQVRSTSVCCSGSSWWARQPAPIRISGVLAAVADGRVSTGQATAATLLLLCGVVGKSRAVPAALVAARRHAGADPDQRTDPCGDDGGRRRLPGGPPAAVVPAVHGHDGRACGDRRRSRCSARPASRSSRRT